MPFRGTRPEKYKAESQNPPSDSVNEVVVWGTALLVLALKEYYRFNENIIVSGFSILISVILDQTGRDPNFFGNANNSTYTDTTIAGSNKLHRQMIIVGFKQRDNLSAISAVNPGNVSNVSARKYSIFNPL